MLVELENNFNGYFHERDRLAENSIVDEIKAYSGVVKIGGHDVRDYDITALRDAVSMVLQKNVLFSGTIMENLQWGDPNATEEQCKKACQSA